MTQIPELERELRDATDSLQRLLGARRVAFANGDQAWLADVRAALPAALGAQRDASAALRDAMKRHGAGGGLIRG
jgi:hypothetical protein